ncbi:endolytic transglycosylase MltG, partial [Candidatus Gottesmanbacteria bacterium]|nr:endolytic transglycosylase MltG [Candidatus Gottesmanbacteria bacterium]
MSSSETEPVMFVINRGDGVRTISANLSAQHLIRSPTAFFILVKLMRLERSLQAGDFRLNRTMDARQIATELTHGFLDVWVTTLEGWRVEEIANRLAKDLDIPEAQFLSLAREGYMFPDTYLIPRDA